MPAVPTALVRVSVKARMRSAGWGARHRGPVQCLEAEIPAGGQAGMGGEPSLVPSGQCYSASAPPLPPGAAPKVASPVTLPWPPCFATTPPVQALLWGTHPAQAPTRRPGSQATSKGRTSSTCPRSSAAWWRGPKPRPHTLPAVLPLWQRYVPQAPAGHPLPPSSQK